MYLKRYIVVYITMSTNMIQYPRICACCSYSAKSQQAWFQHTKTKKHAKNSGNVCPVATPVPSEPSTVQALLSIIQQQSATIQQQAETIKIQAESLQRHESNARGGGGNVQPQPSSPSVTLNISELVPKQPSTTRVKQPTTPCNTPCNTPCDSTHATQATPTLVKPQREAAPADTALNVSDVLEPDFCVGAATTSEDLAKLAIKRFVNMGRSKRPIRFYKGEWEYKQDNTWRPEAQINLPWLINKRFAKQYLDYSTHLDNHGREATDITDHILVSLSGVDDIDLWGPGKLTKANCCKT